MSLFDFLSIAAGASDVFNFANFEHGTPPPISRSRKQTKGRAFASQKERANRRKAKKRARA